MRYLDTVGLNSLDIIPILDLFTLTLYVGVMILLRNTSLGIFALLFGAAWNIFQIFCYKHKLTLKAVREKSFESQNFHQQSFCTFVILRKIAEVIHSCWVRNMIVCFFILIPLFEVVIDFDVGESNTSIQDIIFGMITCALPHGISFLALVFCLALYGTSMIVILLDNYGLELMAQESFLKLTTIGFLCLFIVFYVAKISHTNLRLYFYICHLIERQREKQKGSC